MTDHSEYVRFRDLNAELTNYARRDGVVRIEGDRVVVPGAKLSLLSKAVLIGLLVLAIKAIL
jgi:hypothetical protein